MARRPLAGRDAKIIQGKRRDAFFQKMRRKGGVPRMPDQAPELAAAVSEDEETTLVEDTTAETEASSETPADGEAVEKEASA